MNDTNKVLFVEAMRTVAARLPETDYVLWLKDLQFNAYEAGILTLSTNFLIKKERIAARYTSLLTKSFAEHFADFKTLCLLYDDSAITVGANSTTSQASADNANKSAPPSAVVANGLTSQSRSSLQTAASAASSDVVHDFKNPLANPLAIASKAQALIPNVLQVHNFDNFLVVEENELVYSFAQKAVKQFARNSPLYFYGPVGVGKTHLLQAIANEVQKKFPFYKIRYVTPDKFIHEFTTAILSKTDRDFRLRYQSVDLLIIDDVQFFGGKHKSSIEFFHIFNAIYTPGKQLVFASDIPPAELEAFDLRLKSRLAASIIATLPSPQEASRKRLLSFFAQRHRLPLSAEVLDFLAKRLPGNVRELKGAIRTLAETLAIYAEQGKSTPPSIQFCRTHLAERFDALANTGGAPQKLYAVHDILKGFCKEGQITIKELCSRKKTKHLAQLRQYAAYFLKYHTQLSISEIGHHLGGKTPSAISYSVSTVTRKLQEDGTARSFFSKLEQQLQLATS